MRGFDPILRDAGGGRGGLIGLHLRRDDQRLSKRASITIIGGMSIALWAALTALVRLL